MSTPVITTRCLGYLVDPITRKVLLVQQEGVGGLIGFFGRPIEKEGLEMAMSRIVKTAGTPAIGYTQWLHLGTQNQNGSKLNETVRTEVFAAQTDLTGPRFQNIPGTVLCNAAPRKGSPEALQMSDKVLVDLANVLQAIQDNTPDERKARRRMLR
jgi:hypothetical protein